MRIRSGPRLLLGHASCLATQVTQLNLLAVQLPHRLVNARATLLRANYLPFFAFVLFGKQTFDFGRQFSFNLSRLQHGEVISV